MAGLSSQLAPGSPDSRLLRLELHGIYMGSEGLNVYKRINHREPPQPPTHETLEHPGAQSFSDFYACWVLDFGIRDAQPGVSEAGGELCRFIRVSSHLVSLCVQEPDVGLKVAEEVVSEAETGVWMESEAHMAQVAEVAQPQPLLAMASVRREGVGVEVAVLAEELQPVDQQRVLAR